MEECLYAITDSPREYLPDLGAIVAIDSTTVPTHSNPDRKTITDQEAGWTAKTSTSPSANKDGKEWREPARHSLG